MKYIFDEEIVKKKWKQATVTLIIIQQTFV